MKKVFIAIPTYGYSLTTPCAESLLKLQELIFKEEFRDR